MRVCCSLAVLIAFAACGGSDSPGTADAAVDGAGPSVRTVTCPPGQQPTVTTSEANDTSYTPSSVTISVGGIVQFVMSPSHNVAPNTIRASDPGLHVDFGKTACLEFDKAGTFSFICTAHGFAGTVVVQ